jgi:hypothetical protein
VPPVCAQSPGGQQAQAIGRTKGGLNTKIAALVEGRLMAAAIAPGQVYEVEAAAPLLETLRRILLAVTRASTAMPCAARCWPRAAWPPSRRDRGGVLQPGFIEVSIGNVIRSKTSSSGSKSTNVSPPVMKNSLSLSSISSSWPPSSTGSSHFENSP